MAWRGRLWATSGFSPRSQRSRRLHDSRTLGESLLDRLPPLKDLSQYLSCDPYYSLKNPGGPVQQFRVTNTSSTTVSGPIHLLVEGIAQGRSVVNPDGDYLGSPFINLVSTSLAPGQSEDVSVQFNNDSTGAIPTFQALLASGDF